MTFASAKTKSAVIAGVLAAVEPSGYRLYASEAKTHRTQFRRKLTDDVVVEVQVEFFDGALASAEMVHMQATFGIASKKLLAIYYKLFDEPPKEDFFPIGGSLRQHAPNKSEGSWSFEVPARMEHAQHFGLTIRESLEELLRSYDTAEKQIASLPQNKALEVHWNDYFFDPIGHLYLGQKQEAIAVAKQKLEAAPNEAFKASYRHFYESVVRAAA